MLACVWVVCVQLPASCCFCSTAYGSFTSIKTCRRLPMHEPVCIVRKILHMYLTALLDIIETVDCTLENALQTSSVESVQQKQTKFCFVGFLTLDTLGLLTESCGPVGRKRQETVTVLRCVKHNFYSRQHGTGDTVGTYVPSNALCDKPTKSQHNSSVNLVALKNASEFFWVSLRAYARSPRMRRASWMSLGMMVTRLAWMAHRLVSSNRPTRYASAAS